MRVSWIFTMLPECFHSPSLVESLALALEKLMVDVVAVGGCYKPEGETVTLEEINNTKKVPLALVSSVRDSN